MRDKERPIGEGKGVTEKSRVSTGDCILIGRCGGSVGNIGESHFISVSGWLTLKGNDLSRSMGSKFRCIGSKVAASIERILADLQKVLYLSLVSRSLPSVVFLKIIIIIEGAIEIAMKLMPPDMVESLMRCAVGIYHPGEEMIKIVWICSFIGNKGAYTRLGKNFRGLEFTGG
jgi:hypothetical protein